MKLVRLIPLAALALALASCAPARVPWVNSRVPKSQWAHDWSDCKRSAEGPMQGFDDRRSLSDAPFQDYDRAKTKRETDSTVALCMTSLGYVPAPRKGN